MSKEIMLSQPLMPTLDEYMEELKDIWNTKKLATFGPKNVLFEEGLRQYLEIKEVAAFSNGHTALESAIGALCTKGEAITTPFTFISTVNAITRNGLEPIFCDIGIDMTIDAEQIERLISDKTTAIIPVHMLGNVCDVMRIEKLGKKYGLKVIYDGAHVFGAKYLGKSVCNYGDATMYSFHSSKVFNTAEGGAVACSSNELMETIKLLRYYGLKDGNVSIAGTNGKMHELTAALGLCNLKLIDQAIQKRGVLVSRYRDNLKDVSGIELPNVKDGVLYNYIYFYVTINEKEYGMSADYLLALLWKNGIHAKGGNTLLVSAMDCYKACRRGNLENAERSARDLVVLPLYPNLLFSEVDMICQIICENCNQKRAVEV